MCFLAAKTELIIIKLQLKANNFEFHLLTYLILFSGQPYLLEMLYLPVEGAEFEGQYMKVKIT